MIFGAKSSPSIAEFCYRNADQEFAAHISEIKRVISDDIYVDDVTGTNEDYGAIRLPRELTKTSIGPGRISARPLVVQIIQVLEALSAELKKQESVNLDVSDVAQRRLGVHCRLGQDVITYKGKVENVPPTKRLIIARGMSVYDPLRILIPGAVWKASGLG